VRRDRWPAATKRAPWREDKKREQEQAIPVGKHAHGNLLRNQEKPKKPAGEKMNPGRVLTEPKVRNRNGFGQQRRSGLRAENRAEIEEITEKNRT
jgi:hypothetical protein